MLRDGEAIVSKHEGALTGANYFFLNRRGVGGPWNQSMT